MDRHCHRVGHFDYRKYDHYQNDGKAIRKIQFSIFLAAISGAYLEQLSILLLSVTLYWRPVTVVFTAIHITQVWILPNTSNYLVMVLFMLPGFLITRNGVRVLGRYAEVVFYLTLWMPILIAIPLQKGTVLHMPPCLERWMDSNFSSGKKRQFYLF
ncbi:MAG: hypothetical protein KatS3mg080_0941 [Anoxybacillus sp.]|nr:MAG: hypothetical protein KatS3mg080_0941 [Anoxybacillus sp.]